MGSETEGEKEMTRLVVCDTGPLLHLSEAGVIHLLERAGQIVIPPAVAAEFEGNSQGWRNRNGSRCEIWMKSQQADQGAG